MKPATLNLPKILFLIAIICFAWISVSATMIVNENIGNWTAHSSYGSYTQEINIGTINLTRCLVSPGSAGNGLCSPGRIQMEASSGIVEFPIVPSLGEVEFTIAAGSSGRSVRLQRLIGASWMDVITFNNIGGTGSRFFVNVGQGEATKIRLFFPSHAIYVHDIFITDYQNSTLPILEQPSLSQITYNSALATTMVGSAGGSNLSVRGFCWSTAAAPDTTSAHITFGSGISPINGTIANLLPNTTYYVRAYAVNASGIAYSPAASFQTIGIDIPTAQVTNFVFYPGNTSIQASWTPGNGSRRLIKINTAESFTDPQNGVEYTPNSIYSGSGEQVVYCDATQIVEGENLNEIPVTGLVRNTTYWFRAYEMNGSGASSLYNVNFALNNPASTTTLNTGIAGYYNNATGYGSTLKSNLHEILRTTHLTQFSYAAVWQQLQYTDEDSLNTNNVIETYTGWSVPKNFYGTGATQWNREHTWSVSHGGFETNRPAGTDLHHLRPCDVTVNSAKNNRDFDIGGTPYIDSSPYPNYSATTGCNTSTNTWEPRPIEKGDVARMLFYMAVRYEGTDTAYNLEMADTSATTGAFYGKLSTLLQWHYDDPPDNWERRRNDRIQERQGNRNPFIDHPEFVTKLWTPLATAAVVPEPYQLIVRWDHSINAQGYAIDVSTDPDFTNLVVDNYLLSSEYVSHLFELPGVDDAYYRVRAFLGSGYSPYSNVIHAYLTPLPLEISLFETTLTEQRSVNIRWVTEYETGISGYRIYRNTNSDLNTAMLISPLIAATNTSTAQTYQFQDTDIPNEGANYCYWLKALTLDGREYFFGPSSIVVNPSSASDDTQSPALQDVKLYPNPFAASVKIEYNLKNNAAVNIQIFNLRGQCVKSWNAIHQTGKNSLEWDGRDNRGKLAGAGIYLLKISTPDKHISSKLLKLQ
ncbi:MAG: endonuclease [Candidatus Cloacimonetes bacterium]|nr:endonuclease [Candidatus Cloacimonadota bacterium]MDD3235143.1 endonuclease [Candidatus Cloacimonadota bacterium]